jgi:hypothetical protein
LVLLLCGAACGGKSLDAHGVEASSGGPNIDPPDSGVPSGGAPSDAGTAPERDACSSNSDCRLLARGCCSCGTGPLSSFAAINLDSVAAFSAEQCMPGVACGACPPIVPDPNAPENYYMATCQAGHCVAVDLRAESFTDCNDDSDCLRRSGTNCCDACGNDATIVLNKRAEPELRALACDSAPACQDCGRSVLPVGVGVFPHCQGGKCLLIGGCNMCFE